MANPKLILQKTSLDVVIQLSHPSIQTPVNLSIATGEDAIFDVNTPDSIMLDITATGALSVANIPFLVEGTITQHAGSPAINLLDTLNKSYLTSPTNIAGATISVVSPSGGENVLYQNVFILKPFGGYSYGRTKSPYVFNFKATLPDNLTAYQNAVNALGGLINTAV